LECRKSIRKFAVGAINPGTHADSRSEDKPTLKLPKSFADLQALK
jgi:hypothetical protein